MLKLVDLAGDDGALAGLVGDGDELDVVQVGQGLAVVAHLKVVGVAIKLAVDARIEGVPDEGAGAEHVLVQLHALVSDGVALLAVDHQDGVVRDEAEHRGEGLLRRNREGEVVDHIDAVDLVELALDELGVVLVEAIQAEGRVLGIELPPVGGGQVVPVDVGVQLEDVGEVVGLLGERLRELGHHVPLAVVGEDAAEGAAHADGVGGGVVRDGGVVDGVARDRASEPEGAATLDVAGHGSGLGSGRHLGGYHFLRGLRRGRGRPGGLGRLGGLSRLGSAGGRGSCRGPVVVIVVATADEDGRGGAPSGKGGAPEEGSPRDGTPAHVPGPIVLGHVPSFAGTDACECGAFYVIGASPVTWSGAPDGRPALVRCR